MRIQNVSGETRYFGFGHGVRGRTMAHLGISTVPDNDPFVLGMVQNYVAAGKLLVVEGPTDVALTASINTPAFGYLEVNGAAADNDTFTVGGIVFEYENDPGGGVLGQYVSTLSATANKWAGDGAAAGTAAGTVRTAINVHTATTGIVADAPIEYETGKFLIPLRAANGSPTAGTSLVAKSGANLAILHGSLVAGVTGKAVKTVIQKYTVVAGDVTNAALLLATGLSRVDTVVVTIVDATGVLKAWNGATLISGGNVVLNNAGLVDWAATDVVTILATGY